MERYTLQQRIEIVQIHYKNGENFAETDRKVKSFLGSRRAPPRPGIVKLVQKFELLGQVMAFRKRLYTGFCLKTCVSRLIKFS